MTTRSRDAEVHAKQEGNNNTTNDLKLTKAPSSSGRQWSAFRNPRIVRVSRSFGGKDRHSKVCTIRGLRDRRIRLSVPTAIQLYDLQDRLGLSQPSKVVDWLLEATKLDIDKLPPLHMPQGSFGQFLEPMMASHHQDLSSSSPQSYVPPIFHPNNSSFLKGGWPNSMLSTSRESVKINEEEEEEDQNQTMSMSLGNKFKHWELVDGSRSKGKEVLSREFLADKTKWMDIDDQITENNNSEAVQGYNNNNNGPPMLSAQQFFPASNHSNALPAGLMNNPMPYNSSYSYPNWDPSNLSLAQFGSQQGLLSSMDDQQDAHNYGNASSSSLTGSQLFLCPPTMLAPPPQAMMPAYPSYFTTPVVETDAASRQNANTFQHSLVLPPHHQQQNYQLNVNYPKLFFLHSQSNDESQTNDDSTSS